MKTKKLRNKQSGEEEGGTYLVLMTKVMAFRDHNFRNFRHGPSVDESEICR